MTDTTHLGLPLIAAAQAQKHVTHNEALQVLGTALAADEAAQHIGALGDEHGVAELQDLPAVVAVADGAGTDAVARVADACDTLERAGKIGERALVLAAAMQPCPSKCQAKMPPGAYAESANSYN